MGVVSSRRVLAPWFALVAACGGANGRRPPPAAPTAIPAPAALDASYALAPQRPLALVRVRPSELASTGSYAAVLEVLLGVLGARHGAVIRECGADPMTAVDEVLVWVDAAHDAGAVVRGAVTRPERAACRDAWLRVFGLAGPDGAPGARAVTWSPSANDPSRVVLGLPPHAGPEVYPAPPPADPRAPLGEVHHALLARGAVAPVDVSLDLDAIAPAGTRGVPRLPDVPPERSSAAWNAARGVRLRVEARGQDLAIEARAVVRSESEARELVVVLDSLRRIGVARLRAAQSELLAGQLDAPSVRDASERFIERVSALRFTAEGASVVASVAFDHEALVATATLSGAAFRSYTLRARTAEAYEGVAYLARMAATHVGTERVSQALTVTPRPGRRTRPGRPSAQPAPAPRVLPASAPRTPAQVPAGVAVVDPAGTWEHPTWQALHFARSEPHRYSYEVVTEGTTVTVRAYGDLDGDGTLSTFERTGTLDPQGELVIEERTRVTNETE